MRLTINDGYTLTEFTKSDYTDGNREWSELPVVEFSYRPALPDAIYEWQHDDLRAANGKAALDAAAKLVAGHLTKWDVMDGANPAPIHHDSVRKLPMPILQQLIKTVTTWAAKKGDVAGN